MTNACSTSSSSLADLEGVMARLKTELGRLGLNLTVWDTQGQAAIQYAPCRLGAALGLSHGASPTEIQDLAMRITAEGQPSTCTMPGGCCLIGVPIMHRRRVVGAATVCFPVKEMSEGPAGMQLCEQTRLERKKIAAIVREHTRYSMADADQLLQLLSWLISREQALHVAESELITLSTNLATTYEELSLLYRISSCMKVTGNPEDFLQTVITDLLEVMNIEGAIGLVYAHKPAVPEDILVLSGDMDLNQDQVHLLTATQIAHRLAHTNRPMLDNHFVAPPGSGLGNAVKQLVAVQLVDNDPIGMLIGINKRAGDFDSSDLKLLSSIANQASVFLVNNRLYADLQDLLMGVLHALSATIDAKDPYTHGHSRRVAMLSRRLAERFGLPSSKVKQIYLAGLLHDIGKIGVPERVLCKEGRLTEEEYETIKRHPGLGAKILQGIRQLDEIIVGIISHHERPDGKGYPRGLKGEELPLEGRIVGMADVFDAMTSDRTYRRAMEIDRVISEIRRCAGTQFDPQIVDLLLNMDIPALMKELRSEDSSLPLALSPEDFKT